MVFNIFLTTLNVLNAGAWRIADIRARGARRQIGAIFPTLAGGKRSLLYNHLAWVTNMEKATDRFQYCFIARGCRS